MVPVAEAGTLMPRIATTPELITVWFKPKIMTVPFWAWTLLPAANEAAPVEAETSDQPDGTVTPNCMLATPVVPAVKVTGTLAIVPAVPVTDPTDKVGNVVGGGGGGGGGGGAAALIVSVSVAEPVPPLFVALIVIEEVPDVVGVPEIRPVVVFTDSPEGNPVALKLVGLLVAVIW